MNHIEHAIDEIERVLIGNKSRDVEEVYLQNAIRSLKEYQDNYQKVIAYRADKWHEDMGDVLWWESPIREAPYCGTPLDDGFPEYKTHFTIIKFPDEVEPVSKWEVNIGDLVIRKGKHEAKVYFVEGVDDDGVLLVNGIKDEFYTDEDDEAIGDETLDYFYTNFRLLAKSENLEEEN